MRDLPIAWTLPQLPEAACRRYRSPDIFFPGSKRETETWLPIIKSICETCIEAVPCLEYALKHQIDYGIWAGTTPEERDLIIEARLRNNAAKSKGAIQSIYKEKDSSDVSRSLLEYQQ